MLLVLALFSHVFGQPDMNMFDKFPKGVKKDPRFEKMMKPKEEKMTFFLYSNQLDDPRNQEFLEVGKNEKFAKIKFKFIDCIENKYYCEDLGIKNFPAASFVIGEKTFNYTWDFKTKDYEEFALKVSADPVVSVHDADVLSEFSRHPVSFILYFNPEVTKILNTGYIDDYKMIAKQYKNTHVYLGICQTAKVSYLNNIDRADLPILLQLGADEAYRYNISKALNKENMQEFIANHKCLMKVRVTQSNWLESLECFKGKIVGISFLGNEPPGKLNIGHLNFFIQDLRLENDWRFQFASVNLTTFEELGRIFGVQAPSFALIDYREGVQVRVLPNVDFKDYEKMRKLLNLAWNGEDLKEFGVAGFQVSEESKTLKKSENPENPEKNAEILENLQEKPLNPRKERAKTEDL